MKSESKRVIAAAMKRERAAWKKYLAAVKSRARLIRDGAYLSAASTQTTIKRLQGKWLFASNMVLWHLHRSESRKCTKR